MSTDPVDNRGGTVAAVRATRLVALLLRLQSGGGTTAADLARELDVSIRTIYRDVADLQGAGFPLWTETGPGGGIRLVEGWRTRLDGLSGDEAVALLLGAAPTAAGPLGLATAAVAARSKLLGTVPPELRGRAAAVAERFHLDAPGWFTGTDAVPHLAELARAVWDGRRVHIGYRRRDGTVARDLAPLGLVLKGGLWYLVAQPVGEGGPGATPPTPRSYRVSRVDRVDVTDGPVDRPPGFDLAAWWEASVAEFDRSVLRAEVRLRLSPRAARLLRHLTDPHAARRALDEASAPDAEGWVTATLAVESPEVAHDQLLGLGDGVEVLDPPELRAALAATARAMAVRHA